MKKIEIPVNCPVCDSKLELVQDQLFCRNSSCAAQVQGKLEHFAKTMKIKGLGPSTIEKLALSDFTELYYLDETEIADVIGEKLAVKLFDEINKSRNADLAMFIAAMSIPLIGGTASEKIANVISNPNEITDEKCKEAGLGEKATANLMYWIKTEYQQIKEYLPFDFKPKEQKIASNTGQLVCITGKLKSFSTKAEATKALEAAGYRVTDNLTKVVQILVDESNKGSSKRTKAETMDILIVEDLAEFLNI